MAEQTHHLHLDPDDQGHTVIHCIRCGYQSHDTFPAEPCPQADVAVLCTAEETGIVIEAGEDER